MAAESELIYQGQRAATIAVEPTTARVLERYRRAENWRRDTLECVYRMLGDVRDKRVLDFGCGEGLNSVVLAAYGAEVTGVDVSPELLALAERRAALDRVPVRLLERDILRNGLPGKYEAILCVSVLHHVPITKALPILLDRLEPGGLFVALEPIALAPWLRRLRLALPIHLNGSPDEHPLTPEEFRFVLASLPGAEVRYFDLFGRLGQFVGAHRLLAAIDSVLLRLPGLRRYAGVAIIAVRL